MTLTRPFSDTVKARAARDPEFRIGMLREAVELLVSGDLSTGKLVLRDYVNATIGFPALGEKMGKSPKVLMRMMSTDGNPTASNIFAILARLQEAEGVTLVVQTNSAENKNARLRHTSNAA